MGAIEYFSSSNDPFGSTITTKWWLGFPIIKKDKRNNVYCL
jgi:hypothetical protein